MQSSKLGVTVKSFIRIAKLHPQTLTLIIPRGVLRGLPLVCYWLTSVEINKHKIFDTNNA